MKRFPLFLAVLGLLTLGGTGRAHAQTARELLDALPAQIRAEAEARKKASPAPNGSTPNQDYLLSIVRAARVSLDAGEDNAAAQQLQQVQTNGATNSQRDICDTIIRKIRQERTEQQTAAAAAITDMLKRAGETVINAKNPKDLDATILELSHAAEDPALPKTFENRSEPYSRRLQSASAFVIRWQDCLAGANRVEGRSASENFRALLYPDNGSAMQSMNIPRSELLARIPAPPTPTPTPARYEEPTPRPAAEVNASITAILDKLHTLDDLPTAIRSLTALRDETQNYSANRGYGTRANELGTLLQRLHDLEQAYAELRSGLDRAPETWWGNHSSNQSELPDEGLLVPLRAQLLTLALPRLLNAPDTEKPVPGERVDTFLNRLIDAARHRADWPTVARGVEYRRLLLNPRNPYDGSGRSEDGRDENTAFKLFFAGENFEQAAQYEQSVAAYLSALSTGSQEIPVTLISERLAAIRKAHPKEYSGGARAVAPSAGESSYENAVRFYRGRMVPTDDTTTAAAVTPAPSATPSPSPVKSPSPSPSASPTASP